MSKRTGLYSGSFDPVTFGHVDIVRRAGTLVDRLVIAIGTHHDKHPLFAADERVKLASAVLKPVAKEIGLKLDVTTYDTLTVAAARDATRAMPSAPKADQRNGALKLNADAMHEQGF